MKRFYSVSEVADEFEVTPQAVRTWIKGKKLLAVRATVGGAYRIPSQALVVLRQNLGLEERPPLVIPEGHTEMFDSSEALFQARIAPELARLGVPDMPGLLRRAETEADVSEAAGRLMITYSVYLRERSIEQSRTTQARPTPSTTQLT